MYQKGTKGMLVNTFDTPMVYMGQLHHHLILMCDNKEPNNHRPVYSWIINNTWEINFKMDLSGFGEFCYGPEMHNGTLEESLQGLQDNDLEMFSFIIG